MLYSRRDNRPSQLSLELAGFRDVQTALAAGACSVEDQATAVLVIFDGKRVFQLNAVAALIWELLRRPQTGAAVAQALSYALSGRYQVDTQGFLDRMIADGLVSAIEDHALQRQATGAVSQPPAPATPPAI